jgi:serine/threonine-protein kinase
MERLNLIDLVPGKEIAGRYRIVRPNRQRGMAATFEAENRERTERCELQIFPGSLFEGRDQAAEFVDRLSAWRELSTPAVLQLRDMRVFDDAAVLLVTAFPPGRSLRGWMSEHARMPGAEVRRLGLAILDGLVEVHAAGLTHGDIKPAVIYFQPREQSAVLLDGGITPGLWAAKHLGTRTALIGTPYYAPLEQFSGDSPDHLTDLYSVATVMYELLAGVLPWSGKGYIEVFQSKMQPAPPPIAQRVPALEIDPELEAVVAKGLRAKRKERHASASEFRDRLAAVALS